MSQTLGTCSSDVQQIPGMAKKNKEQLTQYDSDILPLDEEGFKGLCRC